MIICAALKIEVCGRSVVVPCRRHGDGYAILYALCPEKKYGKVAKEGFINHKGEFLDRVDAYDHAITCGQISAELRDCKEKRGEYSLFSEDLY